jgi:plastocyanin
VAAAAASFGACNSDGAEVVLVEGVTVDVDVLDNTYEPEALEVAAGTEVRFTNRGRNEHDVVPVDGGDDADGLAVSLDELEPGASVTRRLTAPGTYDYYCSIHGTETAGMIGTVTVTGG